MQDTDSKSKQVSVEHTVSWRIPRSTQHTSSRQKLRISPLPNSISINVRSILRVRSLALVTKRAAESEYSKYIPGGYSPTRCLKLKGRPMMYAILVLAGCSILFFGYDAGVMALVNTNPDYQHHMGTAGGTSRDAAAIGGLVSLWFGGFGIGVCF